MLPEYSVLQISNQYLIANYIQLPLFDSNNNSSYMLTIVALHSILSYIILNIYKYYYLQ